MHVGVCIQNVNTYIYTIILVNRQKVKYGFFRDIIGSNL